MSAAYAARALMGCLVGMGLAAVVLIVLSSLAIRAGRSEGEKIIRERGDEPWGGMK